MRRRWLAATACALLTGCASHTNVRVGFSGTPIPPGTSVSQSSLGVRVDSGSVAGTLIAIAILAAAWHAAESDRHPGRYGVEPFPERTGAAPLDETRRVNEQDCTRPIEDSAANLRCR